MNGSRTERLIALLKAQRDEVALRARLGRDRTEWTASSSRLDRLNDQIMHMGAYGSTASEMVGDGLDLDLDSRPVQDAPFRGHVVDSVREALGVLNRGRRARGRLDRGSPREMPSREIHDVISQAQARLRQRYPNAVIAPGLPPSEPDTIILRADRDGSVV